MDITIYIGADTTAVNTGAFVGKSKGFPLVKVFERGEFSMGKNECPFCWEKATHEVDLG